MGLTFTTAFIAGMLSFISPCVLPLAPGYVALISGVSVEELRERQGGIHWRVLLNALLFVLGFSILFVALGASAGAVGRFLSDHREIMNRIAGAVIVFFGAVLCGAIRMDSHSRAKPRQTFPWRDWAGQTAVVSDGTRLRVWLDAMRRAGLGCHADAGLNPADGHPRHGTAKCLFGRIGSAFFADCGRNQPVHIVLSALAHASDLGGTVLGRTVDQCGSIGFL